MIFVFIQAARSVGDSPEKDVHVIEVIFKALAKYGKSRYGKKSDSLQVFTSFDEDDPLKKKEAERLIEYVDHFNNLFDFGQFESAAIHAANSPMGILRTYEVMIQFKQVEIEEGQMSPLLTFCEALMATASAAQSLTGAMSSECIRCALKEGRLDLATHWLAQEKLTYSIPLGDALRDHCKCSQMCTCTCLPMAQTVYAKVGAHHQVVACLCRQEKYSIMLDYATRHGEFSREDYKIILLRHPSPEVAMLMLSNPSSDEGPGLLTFPSVVGALLQDRQHDVLLNVLKQLSNSSSRNLSAVVKDSLLNEAKSDNMTTKKWLRVIDMCQEAGLFGISVEILAVLTIRDALNKASIAFSMDYIS